MKKLCIASVLAAFAATVIASSPAKEDLSKLTPQERMARRDKIVMEKHGGLITMRGTPCGSIVVVNSQGKVAKDNFEITKTRSCSRLGDIVKIVDGEAATIATAEQLKKKYGADFALFVVDDKSLPPSLVAVEARWAFVNVAALEKGAATPEMVRIRTRNEFARVFAMLCGGFSSQFKAPLTNMVKTVGDLDECLVDLPVDVVARISTYLDYCGIKAEKKITYRRACQEGWAPQPTNSFQKAVWDEVHSLPTKPITIKYDKKKGE